MKKSLLLILLLGCLSFNTKAEDPTKLIHNRQTYVDDYADVFTPEQEAEMDRLIKQFKKNSTVEFSIVSVNNLNGLEVDDFAQQLFTSWGIGGASNNGCLILISVDPRKLRTHTGYGLEGDLTDYTTKKLQESVAVPLLKENKRGEGVLALLTAYLVKLDPVAKEQRRVEEEALAKKAELAWNSFVDGFFVFLGWVGVAIISFLIFLFFKKKQREKREREAEEQRRLEQIQREKEQEERRIRNLYDRLEESINSFSHTIHLCKTYKPNHVILLLENTIKNLDFSKTEVNEINQAIVPIQEFVDKYEGKFREVDEQIRDILSDLETIKNCSSKVATFEKQYNECKKTLLKHQESYPEVPTTFPDISKNLSTIKYLQTEGEKMSEAKNYNKVDVLVSSIDAELRQINHAVSNLEDQINKFHQITNTINSIGNVVKNYRGRFTNLLAYSFIPVLIKERLIQGPQILDNIIKTVQVEKNVLNKISFLSNKYKEVEDLIKLGEREVEKENARVAEIERRERERLRAIQEAEEAERRRKRQQDDDDRRRRDSYSSSSYSSFSDSSSSDFGGGSSGGGGSSSDY